jgi:hypothetical protein
VKHGLLVLAAAAIAVGGVAGCSNNKSTTSPADHNEFIGAQRIGALISAGRIAQRRCRWHLYLHRSGVEGQLGKRRLLARQGWGGAGTTVNWSR